MRLLVPTDCTAADLSAGWQVAGTIKVAETLARSPDEVSLTSRACAAVLQAAHVLPASAQPGGSPRAIAASPGRNRRGGGQHKCCSNCSSQQTPAWRRDKEDHSRLLCNPCGIYKNTNGVDRPLLAGKVPSRKQASGKQLKGGHKVNTRCSCIATGAIMSCLGAGLYFTDLSPQWHVSCSHGWQVHQLCTCLCSSCAPSFVNASTHHAACT